MKNANGGPDVPTVNAVIPSCIISNFHWNVLFVTPSFCLTNPSVAGLISPNIRRRVRLIHSHALARTPDVRSINSSAFVLPTMTEKKYKVNEETLKQTTRCKKNFACLFGDCEFLCETKIPNGTSVYFKCSEGEMSCPYCKSFGKIKKMCTCPTRAELYIRYGIWPTFQIFSATQPT